MNPLQTPGILPSFLAEPPALEMFKHIFLNHPQLHSQFWFDLNPEAPSEPFIPEP